MSNKIKAQCKALFLQLRRSLMRISLEQWICFGMRAHMPQRQLMIVYAGYSLLGTLLLILPVASCISLKTRFSICPLATV